MSALPRRPAGVSIRPMEVSSLGDVMVIEEDCYEFPWTRGNFIDSLAAGYHAQCLIGASGDLLGYFMAMPVVDEMHLLNLSVAPEVQGRGHALTLLRSLVRLCRARQMATLWLEVRPSNQRARDLYERFGFLPVGRRRDYYPATGGLREDAIVMSLALARLPDELD